MYWKKGTYVSGNRLVVDLPPSDVGHDPDDLAPGVRASPRDQDAFSERILAREESAHHRLVDHGDGRGSVAVGFPKGSSAAHGDLGSAEEVGRHAPVVRDRLLVGRPGRPPLDPKVAVHARPAHGKAVGRPGGRDSGQRLQAPERFPAECALGLGGAVARRGQRDLEGRRSFQRKSGIDALEGRHGAEHQAGADEQDERERDLGDDEQIAQPSAVRRPRAAAVHGAGQRRRVGPGGGDRGAESEEDAGRDRDGEREDQDAAVDRDRCRLGEAQRKNPDEQVEAPRRERHSQQSSRAREQDALGQQLTEDASAGGAEGDAQGDLAAPRERAGEQQVGDVGAGDQENERHRSEQGQQRRPGRVRQLPVERQQVHVVPGVGFGKGLLQRRLDRVEVGGGRGGRDPSPEPADDLVGMVVAVGALRRRQREGRPELGPLREVETAGHDADHRVVLTLEPDLLSDRFATALELPLPEPVAQDHFAGPGGVRRARERSAELRPDAEQGEELRRHPRAEKALRISPAAQAVPGVLGKGDRVEAPALRLPVRDVARGSGSPAGLRAASPRCRPVVPARGKGGASRGRRARC